MLRAAKDRGTRTPHPRTEIEDTMVPTVVGARARCVAFSDGI